ncbi:hypothetical protein DICPUDRAFT_159949 [Dictyostelium purpureum]|uniref:Isochorismatase-like domain-containing protein n=1 Tax=Dictyostelium purpureum TaxID=5786 RepID=F1A5C7_DICPU|nr:uncharacterized protein DICPUDRAFT_159949 [Dictyostelium purpureum]EGC28603.1 hypothetical protein DICPUDRAFT_159949 [Dictyostelium purpureum]|eukprot:XP_003294870.1 hypothetical protein DICPUDRAFT_159949 [Dictyostelium purpureum]
MVDSALIIVDEQNDYFTGGKFELVHAERALNNTLRVLEKFREDQQMVIFIQHAFPKGSGSFFEEGSEGFKIHPALIPASDEPVLIKKDINSFLNTGLESILRKNNIKKLVITGMMSHMCVDSATRAAKDLGWSDITVIEDCCATRDLTFGNKTVKAEDVHAAYMSALAFAFAKVITTEEYLKL